jgi:hypothetical protein
VVTRPAKVLNSRDRRKGDILDCQIGRVQRHPGAASRPVTGCREYEDVGRVVLSDAPFLA